MNTYTLEEGRQRELFAQHSAGKAAGAEGKKRLKGIKFFITDYPIALNSYYILI
ncbi:MAG: hypothetical protein F6K17_01710 [Okeania sp. SIO3C4]|nr:hypothetical protein [Okeania sp. SIO3B3]NER01431.1 hypothetical protein [Okeania sp. SIO3C4]